MNAEWRQATYKIFLWLLVEILFNLIGVDTLADYTEFLWQPKTNYQLVVIEE